MKLNYSHYLRPLAGVTLTERTLGGFSIGVFVLIFFLSVAFPFLCLYSLSSKNVTLLAIFAAFTVMAYVPWSDSFSDQVGGVIQRFYRYYAPRHFRRCQIVEEGSSKGGTTMVADKESTQTFYAVHPHGALCMGWNILYNHETFESVRFCFAPYLYFTPFFRLFSRLLGRPGSASKSYMISYLKLGESLALLPGGFEDATLTSLHHDRIFIRKRTGFIRLCLKFGVAVRPVYVFGEKDCYWNIQGGWKWRLALNRCSIPAALPWGWSWIPLLPKKNAALYIVLGEPIMLPQIDDPSKDQVYLWHEKYMAALIKLYETHKDTAYGSDNAKSMKLEMW
ncbi:diacylglycerol acyltransferase [Nitzschia inconspicua]|uniref:Acyltransferase n=1 Tax=Nitzschia inconspicua TaxID=303405 RepID=A0A9K3L5F7_9STRA|nr:diacylglycerol acyltransferase [Nitzschia inconspicua]